VCYHAFNEEILASLSMADPLGAHGQRSAFHFRQMLLKQKKKQQQMDFNHAQEGIGHGHKPEGRW
jgi:trehalose-6-phosphate synthase